MNYKEFISHLKKIKSNKAKIDFIMDFFLENVAYDYVTLEKAKVTSSTVDEIDARFNCSNPLDVEKALVAMRQEYGFSPELIERLEKYYGKDRVLPAIPERIMFGKVQKAVPERTIQNTLAHAFNLSENPCEFKDGIIIKGVCADYALFIDEVCKELNIDSKIVHGTTTVGHVWNIIEGKHYDITYAIFARDNYSGWGRTTKTNWLGVDEIDLLNLQPYRKIESDHMV